MEKEKHKKENNGKKADKINKDDIKIINNEDIDKKTEDIISEKEILGRNKQLKWILILIAVLIGSIFLAALVANEAKKFEYSNIQFQKDKFGQIPIYKTRVAGYNVKGIPIDFNIALREDPRKSNVTINGNLNLILNRDIYFVLNLNSSQRCDDGYVLGGFGTFMGNMGFNMQSAVIPEALAKEYKKPYITCENNKNSTVLILTEGNETAIVQDETNKNCYYLYTKNCETLQVIERLEVAMLAKFNGGSVESVRAK